ncbi:MAG TPA: ABC transporter ATP-binding protein [Gemmatimonadaceae bacterium]|nr:ABC transporter ATP-binding protein [Gemmatimonadaceae bacterium]
MLTSSLNSATSRPAPVLRVRGLTRSFARGLARRNGGSLALDGIDLEVRSEDAVGIIGPEGAGKTTLLQCLAGLLKRDAGTVEWFGHFFPGGGIVPGVAYVPAVPVYYPFLTVRDVLEYRSARETTGRPRPRAIDSALRRLGLSERANVHVAALSHDELRRVSIAEVLSFDPQVILVDAPPGDERPPLSERALDALKDHAASGGAVMIASRHAHSIVRAASRVVVLDEGKILRTFCADEAGEQRVDPVFPLRSGGARFVAERMH